jgi:hypothetical protein
MSLVESDDAPRSLPNELMSFTYGDLREAAVQYFELIEMAGFRARLEQFERLLSLAAELRSDSNYEALLIAHEYGHPMTSAFENLATAMTVAAEESVRLFAASFSAFIAYDPDLESERNAYKAFLYDYLQKRLVGAVQRKIAGVPSLGAQLEELATEIQPKRPAVDYSHLEDVVSMKIFGQKARLMDDFKSKILALETATHAKRTRNGSRGSGSTTRTRLRSEKRSPRA